MKEFGLWFLPLLQWAAEAVNSWLQGPNRFQEGQDQFTLCLPNGDGSWYVISVKESGRRVGFPIRVWLN